MVSFGLGWGLLVLLRSSFCSCLLPIGPRIGRWCGIALHYLLADFGARQRPSSSIIIIAVRGTWLLSGWVGTCFYFFFSADTAISSPTLGTTGCKGVRVHTRGNPAAEPDCFGHTRVYTRVHPEYIPGYPQSIYPGTPQEYIPGYIPEYIPGYTQSKYPGTSQSIYPGGGPEYIPGYPREYMPYTKHTLELL